MYATSVSQNSSNSLVCRVLEPRLPRQLSGGQQQRVALARALAVQPRLLLLDEPFAALDGVLRDTLRQELAQVQVRWGIPVLLVTHDLADVFALGQRVVVYDGGQVIQQGTRDEVFFRPENRRVAEFVRTGNILPGWWIALRPRPSGYAGRAMQLRRPHSRWRRGRRYIFVSVRRKCSLSAQSACPRGDVTISCVATLSGKPCTLKPTPSTCSCSTVLRLMI